MSTMKKRFRVENRAEYRLDPEESQLYERSFPTFSRARAYAKQLPLGGWIDIVEGGKRRQIANISIRKARKCRRRKKTRKA